MTCAVNAIIGPGLEATDPRQVHRRNYAVAMLSIDPGKSNALVARALDDDLVALTLAYRCPSDQTIHIGEIVIPRERWSVATFRVYAKAMGRPH